MKKKLLSILAAAVLVIAAANAAFASSGYSYTVRIYAGAQGNIGGSDVIEITKAYGERVDSSDFNVNTDVTITNDKYYAMGIRESGKDNSTVRASFEVTRDMDFVVAYGVKGNMVQYTVNYVDAAGNELAPSETYYGNIGDKPVVAFLYVEGYQPQAYNLTKTLSANAAENVFEFSYSLVELETETYTVTVPVETTTAGGGGGEGTTPTTPTSSGESTPTEPASGETTPGGETTPEETLPSGGETTPEPTQPSTPEEIIDIDESTVPLGPGGETEPGGNGGGGLPTAAKVGLGVGGGIVGLGAIIFLLLKKRQKKNK